jgi:hypothetical protein
MQGTHFGDELEEKMSLKLSLDGGLEGSYEFRVRVS